MNLELMRNAHSENTCLILGMSHTVALRSALRNREVQGVEVVNLRMAKEICPNIREPLHLDLYSGPVPDFVCLMLGGNAHAVLSLIEHPVPFSVGCAEEPGEVPRRCLGENSRHFIPSSLLSDVLAQRFEKTIAVQTEQVHHHWPDAHIIHISAPPPAADSSSVYENPWIFQDRLHYGISPADLRLEVWKLQTKLYRALANRLGGEFLDPIEEALDDDGFLHPDYTSDDPTHANAVYGGMVLDRILTSIGKKS